LSHLSHLSHSFADRPRHGGNLRWAAQLIGASPVDILDFSASINPLGPPISVLEAIQANLGQVGAYPDPQSSDLRDVLSAVHSVPPAWILPGNGAAELLTWACRELAELEITYLPVPAFGDYRRALTAFQGQIFPVNLSPGDVQGEAVQRGDRPSTPGFPQALNSERFSQSLQSLHRVPASHHGVLLNNPHNPTGSLVTRDQIRPLLERFALVVVDEAFMDFIPKEPNSVIPWIADYPNLVVLRSLTKFYSLPGLRIGYAIAHPDRLQRWQQWRDPWTVNAFASIAAIAALQDRAFQQRTWAWLQKARSPLERELRAIPGLYPLSGAANYLLVHTEREVPPLQRALLERHRLLIRDCLSFPELGDRFFRVAVRTEEENQRLLSALAEVLGDPMADHSTPLPPKDPEKLPSRNGG
jgi:L-threonine-O-3-phosphate decarboxylase